MTQLWKPQRVFQPRVSRAMMARSLLLASSGAVRKCEKESMMIKLRKRMAKWGLAAAKAGLAAAVLAGPVVPSYAGEFDGFDGLRDIRKWDRVMHLYLD